MCFLIHLNIRKRFADPKLFYDLLTLSICTFESTTETGKEGAYKDTKSIGIERELKKVTLFRCVNYTSFTD